MNTKYKESKNMVFNHIIKQQPNSKKIETIQGKTVMIEIDYEKLENIVVSTTPLKLIAGVNFDTSEALITLQKWLKQHKMKSKILYQIHDEITIDMHVDETEKVLNKWHEIHSNL